MGSPLRVTPFQIHVEEEILSDLHTRIRATRWPEPARAVGQLLAVLRNIRA